MEEEEDDEPARTQRNHWFFVVPPVLLGFWLLEVVARLLVELIAPGAGLRPAGTAAATNSVDLLFEIGDWVGILGWTTLFF